MSAIRTFAAAAALAFTPIAAQAQNSPLVGQWSIDMVAGMRVENEAATPIKAKATLTITQVGDSLIATLHVIPNEQVQVRPDARLAGPKATGNTASLTQRSEVTMNMNGEEHKAVAISTWSLTVNGDAITGSITRAIEGNPGPAMPPQPLTGTRVR